MLIQLVVKTRLDDYLHNSFSVTSRASASLIAVSALQRSKRSISSIVLFCKLKGLFNYYRCVELGFRYFMIIIPLL